MSRFLSIVSVLVFTLTLQACSTNPVTGKTQLSMPMSQQIQMGQQNYVPYQQQQGGRYVVDPDLNVYISQVGQKLAAQSPVKLPYEFVVLNNDTPNAWALPGGKIAINRGLLVMLDDEAQLASVLGHEVVHAAAEHSANQMRKAQILGLGVAATGVLSERMESGALLGAGAAIGAQLYQAHYGRDQELEADRYGVKYMAQAGYDAYAAVEMQQKLMALSKGKGGSGIEALFASHPPSKERVKRNRELAKKYPGGTRNKAQFQRAISQLKKDAGAYDKHMQALKAASEKNISQAKSLVTQAIRMQPREALFHITLGHIELAEKDFSGAYKAFGDARRHNPEYFMAYLGAGMSAKKLGRKADAYSELEKSISILPTQIAFFHLGELAQERGDRTKALEYYGAAAQGGGEIGKTAQERIARIQGLS